MSLIIREFERKIVGRVITTLLDAGYKLTIDHGGESEVIPVTDASNATLDEMFACDEERLYASKDGKLAWVFFVYGNDGWDVISDYSTSLEEELAPINAHCDLYAC